MEEHTMTDSTKKTNNLFDFATSELSQDAFLCWSLNWLGVKEDTEDPYYKYGKAMLDLFLGEYKKDTYKEVKVLKQFNKIDVLVLFKDNNDNQYALIIEDKTNTSEHNEQIKKYKEQLNDELSKRHDIKYRNLAENQIYSTYVKTGIMYTDDKFKANESTVIIDINNLHDVISKHVGLCKSDIILDYYEYLKKEINYRNGVEDSINNGEFESRITDGYGQLYFLNCLFGEPEQQYIGNSHTDPTNGKNKKVYINNIYTGTSGGSRWTQFCFWGEQFPNPILNSNVNEFHYLFWRIDCSNHKILERTSGKCITLKYYDENIINNKKLKVSDELSQEKHEQIRIRNRQIYKALISYTKQLKSKYPNFIFVPYEYNDSNDDVKEKLLLSIPLAELQKINLEQCKEMMNDIKTSFIRFFKN